MKFTLSNSTRRESTAFSRSATNSSKYWYLNFLRARHSRALWRLRSKTWDEKSVRFLIEAINWGVCLRINLTKFGFHINFLCGCFSSRLSSTFTTFFSFLQIDENKKHFIILYWFSGLVRSSRTSNSNGEHWKYEPIYDAVNNRYSNFNQI